MFEEFGSTGGRLGLTPAGLPEVAVDGFGKSGTLKAGAGAGLSFLWISLQSGMIILRHLDRKISLVFTYSASILLSNLEFCRCSMILCSSYSCFEMWGKVMNSLKSFSLIGVCSVHLPIKRSNSRSSIYLASSSSWTLVCRVVSSLHRLTAFSLSMKQPV